MELVALSSVVWWQKPDPAIASGTWFALSDELEKGILKKVTDNGIEIQDMKTGEVDTITFELLNELVGLEISISMASKVEINEE